MIKITQFTVGYLSQMLSVPVFGEIPPRIVRECVVVEKLGGDRENHLPESVIRLKCFSDTLAHAEDLSQTVQGAMDQMEDLPEIACCEYGGDRNATDTESKRHCFEVMYTITHY